MSEDPRNLASPCEVLSEGSPIDSIRTLANFLLVRGVLIYGVAGTLPALGDYRENDYH